MRDRRFTDPIKCIIFDFDGTLVGAMPTWVRALKYTSSHFAVKATKSKLKKEFRRSFNNGIPGSAGFFYYSSVMVKYIENM
jgi:phosphoglycolate phosphatase-like HAD superfamily hydrolase